MLVIGGNLAFTTWTKINREELAVVAVIKLVLLPAIILTTLSFVHPDSILGFVFILQACMPTSITLSIIGRHYGTKNQDFINQSIFVTHLACMITLPIFLGLYGRWVHS